MSLLMKSVILTPINKTTNIIEAVSRGDLTKRIDVSSSDEIGEMAKHFNVFADTLHGVITQVAQSSDSVSSAANMLDTASAEMAQGIDEVAERAGALATASEEMSNTASEIARNCVAAAKNSESASSSGRSGEAVIQETIAAMDGIKGSVVDSASIIKNLGVRSDQIGDIVELINGIADQTNLLALNAAIEAARAGEHGRGFAVVADEVRKLAERTGSATKEIGQTIETMQLETKNAVSSMEKGVTEVETGAAHATKSGRALKDILEHIAIVTSEINQIAVASEEETATTNEIANSIQQISAMMQQTASKVQLNAEASHQLADLSKQLKEMVGQFRL
jgi:methyl-accepting chemotaxis protein